MKLSFVYNVEEDYWNDGLKKAIDVLSETWEVRKFNNTFTNYFADFVLVWGAFNSPQEKLVADLPHPKGICVAGGSIDHPDIHKFDLVFVESEWWKRRFRKVGINAHVAFGTNTDLFYNMGMDRQIDYLYPAAYARWKRHERFLAKGGLKMTVGYMQPNDVESDVWQACMADKDTVVLPRVKPEVLAWLYNQAKTVFVPASDFGGGERTVLEAVACGCAVEVSDDNEKLKELLSLCNSRVPNYVDYAEVLRREIGKLCEY